MPKSYYATYTVADTDAGFNVFWHSFLMLSEQEEDNGPIKVIDAVGFNSQPSTTTHPVHKTIKSAIGIKVDLQGGHGILEKEQIRYLNKGGLHGVTFQISLDQRKELKRLYEKQMSDEVEAIKDLNSELEAQGQKPDGPKRFQLDQSKLEPLRRLRPFLITMDLTKNGFNSTKSHDCKHNALRLLFEAGIITPEIRKEIIGANSTNVFPRSSQKVERLRLVSTGNPIKEKGRFYNRTWENNELFWATDPVLYGAPSERLAKNLAEYKQINSTLLKVHEIEITLRKTLDEYGNIASLKRELTHVQELYTLLRHNNNDDSLNNKLATAEKVINSAHLSLTPHLVDYHFVFRAYDSFSMRSAMLCLLGTLVASLWLTNPIGIACMAVSATAAIGMFSLFAQEEREYKKRNDDYHSMNPEVNSSSMALA